MANGKSDRAEALRNARKKKQNGDPRLKPMPGAEPYKYHDRVLLAEPRSTESARAGLRVKRA